MPLSLQVVTIPQKKRVVLPIQLRLLALQILKVQPWTQTRER